MKKVLIVTYYWPPAGGPGVQRVLKFAKYLPQFDWQPIILTVKNGEYPAIDETLEKDIPKECLVFKTDSLEPNNLYKRFMGMKTTDRIPVAVIAEEKTNFKKRVANWVRLNLFIPDAKIGWKPFAVRKGLKIIKELKPDIIFSSSPPPMVHLIAGKLSKKSGLPWVTDFRDPWTDIYYYENIERSFYAKILEKHLEKQVLESCKTVVTVSGHLAEMFRTKTRKNININIIANGFDRDDIKLQSQTKRKDKFIIAYAGKLNEQQNPQNLWRSLASLVKNKKEFSEFFQLLFMGKFSPVIYKSINEHSLSPYFVDLGYLEHRVMIDKLIQADILLLIIPDSRKNRGILTGKVFEYLGMRKYILGIGPKDGDVAKILEKTSAGKVFNYDENLEEILYEKFINWKNDIAHQNNLSEIKKYDRSNLTQELSNLFELSLERK